MGSVLLSAVLGVVSLATLFLKILAAFVTSALTVLVLLTTFHTVEVEKGGDDESISLPSRLRRQRARTLAVEKELQRLSELIIRDFIEYWYDDISDDQEFKNHVRWLLEQLMFMSMSRVLRVDWAELIHKKIIPLIGEMLAIYETTASPENLEGLSKLPLGDRRRVEKIEASLEKKYTFHPAVTNPEPFLRDFATALVGGLLQPQDFSCNAFRSLIRELLTGKILAALVSYADPYWMNYSLWCLPDLSRRKDPNEPPYVGPGYERSEAQKKSDSKLDERLNAWDEEKGRKLQNMEALVEGTFDLHSSDQLSFDAMWDLKIEGASIKNHPSTHVSYELRVKNGEYMWRLNRRYNDFKQLDKRLRRQIPGFSVKLPSRHIYSSMIMSKKVNPEFVKKRRSELQAYLQQLVWDRHVSESRVFLDFLMDRHQSIKATRTGHRSKLGDMKVTRRVQPTQQSPSKSREGGMPSRHRSVDHAVLNQLKSRSKKASSAFDSFKPSNILKGVASLWPRKKKSPITTPLAAPKHLEVKATSNKVKPSPRISTLSPKTLPPKPPSQKISIGSESPSKSRSKNSTRTASLSQKRPVVDPVKAASQQEVGSALLEIAEKLFALDPNAIIGHCLTRIARSRGEALLGKFALDSTSKLLTAPNVQWILRFLREYTWPEGKVYEAGLLATEDEIAEARREGRLQLHKFVNSLPFMARHVFTPTCLDSIFEFLQIKLILKHALFGILEEILLELFPELQAVPNDKIRKPSRTRSDFKSKSRFRKRTLQSVC